MMYGMGAASQVSRATVNNVAIKPVKQHDQDSEEEKIIFMNRDTEDDVGVESQSGITHNDGFLNKTIPDEVNNLNPPHIYVHAPTQLKDKRQEITEVQSPALSEIPRNSQKDIHLVAP